MEYRQTEGIVLICTPFQERHVIATLFTADLGLARFFVGGGHSQLSALSRVECLYRDRGGSTLLQLKEWTLLDPYLILREELGTLERASFLGQKLLQSQLPLKPAPALYNLLLLYLAYAPLAINSATFTTSFLIKLLKHDGLLALPERCMECEAPLQAAALIRGEAFCQAHAPSWSPLFSQDEMRDLRTLAGARSMREVLDVRMEDSFRLKVERLFGELTESIY